MRNFSVTNITVPSPQTQSSFAEFLDNYPTDGNYEWVDGAIIKMRATRQHDDIANFMMFAFHDEIRQHQLNYRTDLTSSNSVKK
jgi:hypothetical protein